MNYFELLMSKVTKVKVIEVTNGESKKLLFWNDELNQAEIIHKGKDLKVKMNISEIRNIK